MTHFLETLMPAHRRPVSHVIRKVPSPTLPTSSVQFSLVYFNHKKAQETCKSNMDQIILQMLCTLYNDEIGD